MLNGLRISAVLAMCAAALFPSRADACSCSPEPVYSAIPRTGARDVPLDVAPVLEGAFDANSLKLTDEMGAAVEFTLALGPRVACLGAWAELLPKQPLAPNTRYIIQVNALYSDSLDPDQRTASISFTTGQSELPDEPLDPPQLKAASVMRGAPDCGGAPANMVCLGGLLPNTRHQVELLMRRGDEIVMRTTYFVEDDGNYALEKAPDCVEVRRRAIDGRRSVPIKICGDQLSVSDFSPRELNESGWLTCRDGLIGAAADKLAVDAGTPNGPVDEDAGIDPLIDGGVRPRVVAVNKEDAATRSAADSGDRATPTITGCTVTAGAPLNAADLWLLLAMSLPIAAAKRPRPKRVR